LGNSHEIIKEILLDGLLFLSANYNGVISGKHGSIFALEHFLKCRSVSALCARK